MSTIYRPGDTPAERMARQAQEQATAAVAQRALEMGYGLLGYYLDTRGTATMRIGPSYPPTWRRGGTTPQCPPGVPSAEWAKASAAATAREQALLAKNSAHAQATHDTADMPDLLRATEHQRATFAWDRALTQADQALAAAARRLAQVSAAVARLAAVERAAPAQRAAAERAYQQQRTAIDAEVERARQACDALGLDS
jgi:hypothetical protein